ncbi:MAG TPA: efflux RND transporter permease subunit [Telluria sp.]
MNLSTPFIRRPVATALLTLGMAAMGMLAYALLPVSGMPEVDIPSVIVSAEFPGANASTVASAMTAPLERALAQIPGLESIVSTSSQGGATITLQFALSRNIDAAAFDVQSAIANAGADLPKNLPHQPTLEKGSPSDAKLLTVAIESDAMPIEKVSDIVETVMLPQMSRVQGVGQIYFHGLKRPAVRIRIDPHKLAGAGLTMEQVRETIAAASVNLPKGMISGARQALNLDTSDQLMDAAAYASLIVVNRNGATTRLRDLAEVVEGTEDVHSSAWLRGKQVVLMDIRKQPGHNVLDTSARIRAALPRIAGAMPPSLRLTVLGERTRAIEASLFDMQLTLVATVALVVFVVFLFLGSARATLIPSLAIPLSLLGTLAIIKLLGFSLNNVSLMALTIVIGFVVDDAIVMLENILRHVEEGKTPLDAALLGAREIGFTIVSMTLSLLAVFLPLLLMDGIVGRLFREFAVTAALAIALSGLVSLTLTPMLCASFLKATPETGQSRIFRYGQALLARCAGAYAASLDWALAHARTVLVLWLATLAATVALYLAIPKGFFPKQDNGLVSGVVEAPLDISSAAMLARMHEVAQLVGADPDVKDVFFYVEGSPAANTGRLQIDLRPLAERSAGVAEVIDRLRKKSKKLVGVSLFLTARQDVQVDTRISKAQYEYTLRDTDLAELTAWGPRMTEMLKTIPFLQDVNSDQDPFVPQLKLMLDRDQMSRLGVTPQQVDQTLHDAFGQRQVSSYNTQSNTYRVVLEVDTADPALVGELLVPAASGRAVALNSFARVQASSAPLSINHDGQLPTVTISFNLAPGHALSEAIDAIRAEEARMNKPLRLSAEFRGTAQAFRASLASQPVLIAAALLAIYIVLGILYESYIHPLTILSTLPSAGVGALAALMLTNNEFSLIALIGVILLIGIVKKNGIMMLDFALDAERGGQTALQAIRAACLLRFRPIMMTTMAALLGALPLAFGSGIGAELRRPLGITMIGGLLLSQLLTLYTTPVIYLYLGRWHAWRTGRLVLRPAETVVPLARGARR